MMVVVYGVHPRQPTPPPLPGINEGNLTRFDFSNETHRKEAERYRLHEVI